MNNEIKGLCLFLGLIGLSYIALLILVALFTGAKIVKGVVIIATFSTMLVTVGLTPQVKQRLVAFAKSFSLK